MAFNIHFILLSSILFFHTSFAQESESEWQSQSEGEISLGLRGFQNDNNPVTEDFGLSLSSQLISQHKIDTLRSEFRVLGRVDERQPSRNILYIQDAWLGFLGEVFQLKVGYQTFNWSAGLAFHPVDFLNSRNFDSNIENAEKKGELSAEIKVLWNNWSLGLYILPRVEDPSVPGQDSRLGLGVDLPDFEFFKGSRLDSDNWQEQGGVRLSYSGDYCDFSFFYFNQIDRNHFYFNVDLTNPLAPKITPFLAQTQKIGGSFQYPFSDFLFTGEFIFYDLTSKDIRKATLTSANDFSEYALGAQYGLFLESGVSLDFIFEYQHLFGPEKTERETLNIFQNDLFMGLRFSLNDEMSKSFLFSYIGDLGGRDEAIGQISYEQRLPYGWKTTLSARFIDAESDDPTEIIGLVPFDENHQLNINLSKFF